MQSSRVRSSGDQCDTIRPAIIVHICLVKPWCVGGEQFFFRPFLALFFSSGAGVFCTFQWLGGEQRHKNSISETREKKPSCLHSKHSLFSVPPPTFSELHPDFSFLIIPEQQNGESQFMLTKFGLDAPGMYFSQYDYVQGVDWSPSRTYLLLL